MNEQPFFNEELQQAFLLAKNYAKEQLNFEFGAAHLLKAILDRKFSLLKQLEKRGIDVFYLEEWADIRIEEEVKSPTRIVYPEQSIEIEQVLTEAIDLKNDLNEEEITLFGVFLSIITPGVIFSYDQIKSLPITRENLLIKCGFVTSPSYSDLSDKKKDGENTLKKYCLNRNKKSDLNNSKIVARDKEIKEIIEIISRFSNPNVLLQGYPGVGKTAVINGFIGKVINDQVPLNLKGMVIYELIIGNLVSGASHRGEIEDRLKNLFIDLNKFSRSILVIDGIHALFDKNSDNTGLTSVLKTGLSSGKITLITTTTVDEYTKKIENDENLSGIFEVIKIEEPTSDHTFRILKTALNGYLAHHQINIEDDTILEAIQLAQRFLKEKSLPESALNLLDRTMAVLKTTGETFLEEEEALIENLVEIKRDKYESAYADKLQWFKNDLEDKYKFLLMNHEQEMTDSKEFLDVSVLEQKIEEQLAEIKSQAQLKKDVIVPIDLFGIISTKTGIPIGKLHAQEKEKFQKMESILRNRVVGQDQAISIVSEAILESRSGLNKAGQPMGSFFFLGPTGTGKTELSKSLADFLFQDENAIIRFDMSEFKEEHSAALLYGAPPGYVGYEDGGLLVNKIRQKPYSIVLFDEIEKAHPSVFDVFLQIMDEGKLHDRLGKEGDFSNALILFTSNIGAQFIIDEVNQDKGLPTSNALMELMASYFRPEFLGRLTEIIPFGPISKDNALEIFDIHLRKELFELLKPLKIEMKLDQASKAFLVDNGFNATYGARPLKGIIRSELRRPLAKKIISEQVIEGDLIKISLDKKKNQLKWNITHNQ